MTSSLPVGFAEASPGDGWTQLPLPALILDRRGRVSAINDAAEFWLNISRRTALGRRFEGGRLAPKLRVRPSMGPLFERVINGGEALYRHGVSFEIGDRAGGHHTRQAVVHLGPAEIPAGAVSLLIVPEDTGFFHQSPAFRGAARSAIGMAEMLAHEIKNPLAGIRGAAQLIAMNAAPDDRDMAEMIVSESRRIVSLLDQVERFGDTSPPRLAAVNVHDVLEQVRRSAVAGFARDMRIVATYDPSLPYALADADQLVQVCLNLVKNAAEAAEGGQGGTICLRSSYDHRLRLPADEACPKGRALPLQIEIEDDGPGLPETIADEIFEPFVSGRENGTGLGLALVSKIVADHGALIRVESRPGRTVFKISLPKA